MAIQITQAELLDAIADAQAKQGGGAEGAQTVVEMAEALGIDRRKVRVALQTLQRQGRLTAHKVYRDSITGFPALVPAYTISPKKKK